MLDRDRILAIIDEAYGLRMAGDKAAMRRFFAPGARFRLAGDASLMPGTPADGSKRCRPSMR